MTPTSGPSRRLTVGDECPKCGETITETSAAGLLGYCWWCNDRVGDRPSLHPQNGRLSERGLRRDPPRQRGPYSFVALDDEDGLRHRTPLCPDLDKPYQCVGAETATYVYGERFCEMCRGYRLTNGDSWTDPRYRRNDGD